MTARCPSCGREVRNHALCDLCWSEISPAARKGIEAAARELKAKPTSVPLWNAYQHAIATAAGSIR